MLDIFKQRTMVILLSILWGLGLATLFTAVANHRNSIIVRGEPPYEVEKKVFQYPDLDNKCYKFKSKMTVCNDEIPKKIKI
jgi:hypothetical protein